MLIVAVLSACAVQDPGAVYNDPFEDTNRSIHAFNKGVDRAFVRSAGRGVTSLPEGLTRPITNFADNVGLPAMIANGLLQADIGGAATNTFRFIINSTVGIVGLYDPAGVIGLAEESTDFGETLYVWGVPEGAYIELPLLGPSTQRDAFGIIVDQVLDPLGNVGTAAQIEYGTGARIIDRVITRGTYSDTFDGVLYDSADSYTQARLAYLQNRRFELGDDDPVADAIDPFSNDLSLEGF